MWTGGERESEWVMCTCARAAVHVVHAAAADLLIHCVAVCPSFWSPLLLPMVSLALVCEERDRLQLLLPFFSRGCHQAAAGFKTDDDAFSC